MTKRLNVLIVEDQAADAELMERELNRTGFAADCRRVETEEGFRAHLDPGPDLILADYTLPRFGARRAIEILSEEGLDIPLILVTGTVGEERAVDCMRRGASDYLLKDRLGRLGSAVARALEARALRRGQRLSEEKMRLSELRYRTLVENIPFKVFMKDRESRYVSVNRAYAEDLQLSPEEVIGRTDFELHPSEAAETYYRNDRLVLEEGESLEYDEEYLKEGKRRVIHMVKVPVRDGVGKITGVLGAFADTTAHRQLEEEMRHSQKMEAVGRLAGGVAHDFNNLLTVIGGYAQIGLLQVDEAAPLHDSLTEIATAAERASNLTRQLLAFSRRQVLEIKVLDVNQVVSGMAKMLQRLLGEDIELVTRLSPGTACIKADPGQIEQIVSNLAVNARDAMPHGGRLEITIGEAELAEEPGGAGLKPGQYVVLSVSDEGHGMSAETQARIFEPFFTTKGQGKGTGLGLSTVFGIVKQSGSDIRVESVPGRGTVFRVYFPRVGLPMTAARDTQIEEVPHGVETILVIEDEKTLRNLVARMLRSLGYTVLTAKDGTEALAVLSGHPGRVALVLTDVVMPGGRGPEVLEKLLQVRNGFKVLYMSGYTDDSVVQLELLSREANFVQKPFTLESLARKVREALDRS